MKDMWENVILIFIAVGLAYGLLYLVLYVLGAPLR